MPRLKWDQTGERYYETGVRNAVLYPIDTATNTYPKGVAWNGITAITESPSGAESNKIYADDIKYLDLRSVEEFGCTIEAYTYPVEFYDCDGSAEVAAGVVIGQQTRKMFGLAYRTALGNDTENNDYGYKLHLVYNATAAPSEKGYSTINDSPEAITFSWECTTNPVEITGRKPTACITIDSTKVDATKLAALEDILYGTVSSDARLPLPDEIIALFSVATPEVKFASHAATVEVNGTVELSVTTVPAGAEVTYTASDDDVTVSSAGVVTGVNAGTSIVTAAITVDGVEYTDTCIVTVTPEEQGEG